jgi:dihydropteroate synthase
MIFSFKNKSFESLKPSLVGILNLTPDSFSDGGAYLSPESAIEKALKMIDDGAAIIDVGGESSRPGALHVPEEEEKKRIMPLITELKRRRPDCIISVDTTKSSVAVAALDAGVDIINDISGLRNSQEMASIAAKYNAGLILMHMRGTPSTMNKFTQYDDLIDDIIGELKESLRIAASAGVRMENIIVDPGIGFSKKSSQNLEILKKISRFHSLRHPVMVGHSKKSFLGEITGESFPAKRLPSTVAGTFWLASQGVNFIRVHDVSENMQALKLAELTKKK